MVSNAEIAEIFDEMATLLQKKRDLIFKIRAYRRAAETIRCLPDSLEEQVASGASLRDIPNIGEAIDRKIREYLATGCVQAYEKLKAEVGGEQM
jgi:DNA polymerase (family 10)